MKRLTILLMLLLVSATFAFGQGFVSGSGSGRLTSGDEFVGVTDGSLHVVTHPKYSRPIDLFFVQGQGVPTTLVAKAIIGSYTLTLTSVTGFVDGTQFFIPNTGDSFFEGIQIGAPAGNVITLDRPLDEAYPSGAIVLRTSRDMNVDGSSIPQIFQVGSTSSDLNIEISRLLGYLQDGTTMDDSDFGGGPALTRGCLLRKVGHDRTINLWNVRTNGEIALLCYDFEYPPSPPAGEYSARFRMTYASESKHGTAIYLAAGEVLQLIIQDDLTVLDVFTMTVQGHVIE